MGNPVRRKLNRAKSAFDEAKVLESYIADGDEVRCRDAWIAYRGYGKHKEAQKAAFTYEKLEGAPMDFCRGVRVIITALRG
jgi:hypothetical protein